MTNTTTSCIMLFDFPLTVFAAVVNNWIVAHEIAKLDSATCNSDKRSKWSMHMAAGCILINSLLVNSSLHIFYEWIAQKQWFTKSYRHDDGLLVISRNEWHHSGLLIDKVRQLHITYDQISNLSARLKLLQSKCPLIEELVVERTDNIIGMTTTPTSTGTSAPHIDVPILDIENNEISELVGVLENASASNEWECTADSALDQTFYITTAVVFPHLTSLSLTGLDLSERFIADFVTTNCTLKECMFTGCTGLTDDFLTALDNHNPNITTLAIHKHSSGTIASTIDSLTVRLPRLTSFTLGSTTCDAEAKTALNAFFQYHPHIRTIAVADCMTHGHEMVAAIAHACPALTHLEVQCSYCLVVGDDAVALLAARCRRLQYIDVSSAYLRQDSVLSILQHCPDVRTITASHTPQHNETFKGVYLPGNCPRLQSVYFQYSDMVCDQLVMSIAYAAPNLLVADLSHCERVTTRSMVRLAESCPKLRELYLTGCKQVGSRAVTALHQGCPELRILDILYCTAIKESVVEECFLLRDGNCVVYGPTWKKCYNDTYDNK